MDKHSDRMFWLLYVVLIVEVAKIFVLTSIALGLSK